MKRLFLVVAFLSVIASCHMKPNGEKLVLDYLQKHTNGTEYSIIEISEPDSLYSPFEVINSLMISKSMNNADISKKLTEAFDKPTYKERRAAALEVANLADIEYNNRDDFSIIADALTHPAYVDRPANRVAFIAKYKVDGVIQEDVFYLENNGSAVGHTASDLKDRYLELCKLNSQLYHLKLEAEEIARTIR